MNVSVAYSTVRADLAISSCESKKSQSQNCDGQSKVLVTYVDDTSKGGFLLTKFVLVRQVAEQKQLLVDTFVLG